ncbi:MAG: zinc-ribbon domain-containing protein [Myxococcota bacterium]|jgi:tetratricopeptide (TPR) repeat protein|nr:zinc-ribbon domain-containing protein [Myxococcota bacterium]
MQVSCSKCSAKYVFDVSAIPKEGYNAQCTECGNVFFVRPADDGGGPPAQVVAQTTQAASSPAENAQVEEPQVMEEVVQTQNEVQSEPVVEASAFDSQNVRASVAEMASFDAGIGTEDDGIDDLPSEEEYQAKLERKKKMMLSSVGAVVGVVALAGILYTAVPTVFDATFGKILGIKAAINPDAIPFKDQGIEKLLLDTPEGFAAAVEAFDKALALDPEYPEAIAYKGLAYIFRGTDIQEEGRSVYDQGASALTQLKELKSVPRRKRTKKIKKKINELTDLAETKSKESTALFEKGGKEVSSGYAFINKALSKYQQDPAILAAAGIYYTTDPDGIAKAQMFLRAGLDQTIGPNLEMDLKSPPTLLLTYLQGVIRAASEKDMQQAVAAFDATLTKNGKFVRALMEKALILEKQGDVDAAKKAAQEILKSAAEHGRAKILLARLDKTGNDKASN